MWGRDVRANLWICTECWCKILWHLRIGFCPALAAAHTKTFRGVLGKDCQRESNSQLSTAQLFFSRIDLPENLLCWLPFPTSPSFRPSVHSHFAERFAWVTLSWGPNAGPLGHSRRVLCLVRATKSFYKSDGFRSLLSTEVKEFKFSRNQWSLPVGDQQITVGFRKTLKGRERL